MVGSTGHSCQENDADYINKNLKWLIMTSDNIMKPRQQNRDDVEFEKALQQKLKSENGNAASHSKQCIYTETKSIAHLPITKQWMKI